jgi:succinate dehydrogenase / fumarate reductase cytochrome b subunit
MVDFSNVAPSLGRHEFLLRRLHSLLGLIPLGGYLVFHLATNASILDGPAAFQHRVDQIAELGPTTIFMLEWPFIFLPILFHGIIGLVIVGRGKRNLAYYPHLNNFRYTLQRWTGVIAFLFIIWHVFEMHGWFRIDWWVEHVALPLGGRQFSYENALSAAAAIQASRWVEAAYLVGVLSCVYHFANGVWTMGITWGVWTSDRAQRWANVPVAIVGTVVTVFGLGALYGMMTVDASAKPPRSGVEARMTETPPAAARPVNQP